VASPLILCALKDNNRELALAASLGAHLAGDEAASYLIEICTDKQSPSSVREAACMSLGKLKSHRAVPFLLELVRQEPDVMDDEEAPDMDPAKRIARAAAQAIAGIDPGVLLNEPGQTANRALAGFSISTGRLVFADGIV
jgi:HEAT repeat protein